MDENQPQQAMDGGIAQLPAAGRLQVSIIG
jgi:hypothetical protein